VTTSWTVFLDIDGTLLAEWQTVTEPVRQALIEARQRGHQIYICTGRTQVELAHLMADVEYDGVVGAGGCYLQIGDDLVWQHCFAAPALAQLIERLEEDQAPFYFQVRDALVPSPRLLPALERRIEAHLAADGSAAMRTELDHYLSWFTEPSTTARDDIYKVAFLGGHGRDRSGLADRYGDLADVLDAIVPLLGPGSGELLQPGLSKASGMTRLFEHQGIDPAHTIAIGDSGNDLEMLQTAGIGIAMGNATPRLLAVADEVTDRVEDDGVVTALRRHGLID
jgi:Cof subfamily protein (haloacid dehalogenase superfamily)